MLIDIVIPHFNDEYRLLSCLNSIFVALSFDNGGIELRNVIVVDNGSSNFSAVENICNKIANSKVVLLKEDVPGSYSARNRALNYINKNSSDIGGVFFTDSDCLLVKTFFTVLGREVLKNNESLLAGNVEVFPAMNNMWEAYDELFAFPQIDYVEKHKFGVTAALYVPMSSIDTIGQFSVAAFSGGDKDYCNRCCGAGIDLRYVSDLVIKHPARSNFKALVGKSIRTRTGALMRSIEKEGRIRQIPKLALRIIPRFDRFLHMSKQRKIGAVKKVKAIFVMLLIDFLAFLNELLLLSGVVLWRAR